MSIEDLVPLSMVDTRGSISLRKLTQADLPQIGGWLGEPHVRRWWDPPDVGLSEIASHLADPVVMPYLIAAEDRPIGYLQAYHANAESFWNRFDVPRETIGLDLFLGPPDSLGRGFGSAAIRLVLDRLRRQPRVIRVQIDPAPGNLNAIRAYRRCGFASVGRDSGPDGAFEYMVVDLRLRAPM